MIHEKVHKGYEAKTVDVYEKARPSYPKLATDFIIKTLNLNNNSCVLDMGAGTGKFTRLLEQYNLNITAVEPVQAMIDKFKEVTPNIKIVEGLSTNIPLSNNSIDAIFCAQCFHWFATEETLKEFLRVLKPKGALVLIWTQYDFSCEWLNKLSLMTDKYRNDTPQFKTGKWIDIFNTTKYFKELTKMSFKDYDLDNFVNKQHIWDRVLSVSFISCLSKKEQESLQKEIYEMLEKENSDFANGRETTLMKYCTYLYWSFPL